MAKSARLGLVYACFSGLHLLILVAINPCSGVSNWERFGAASPAWAEPDPSFRHRCLREKALLPLWGGLHLVVMCDWLDLREQSSGFRFKGCDRVVGSGKGSHSFQRIKQVQDDKFHLLTSILPQHVSTPIASDPLAETGKQILSQMPLISICVFRRGPPFP